MNILRTIAILAALFLAAGVADALELARHGKPTAEIVLPDDPMPQARLAASELRDHVRKMSGADLPIVAEPTGERLPVYVGESEHTRRLGLDHEGVAKEGYRIVVTDDYLALFGHDEIFPFYPRGHTDASQRERLLKEWQDYTGEEWDFPFLQMYDPRYFNSEFGFSLHDPSGTLSAVCDLLEQLGVRWYMPHHDFGTVIPQSDRLAVEVQDTTRKPVFARRFLRIGWGTDRDTFLWYKRQRLGVSEITWNCHGTSRVTRYVQDERPEYLATVDGRVQNQTEFGGPGQSRLAAPLRDAMARFANAYLDRYPEQRHVSVGPNDGYTRIDDRDQAAGWLREERGRRGELSDYVWTFINEVAERVAERHPRAVVMGLAYSRYREPPEDFDRLHPNVGVTFCQTRANLRDPKQRQSLFAERERWAEMMGNDEFYVWEYFLWHRHGRQLWGIPVIFWEIMQEDTQALAGLSKGEYVEAWPLQRKELWGINHMTIYLQSRLYWDPNLDREALLDEYYRLFYGPAAGEMREFFEFAESVWMRAEAQDALDEEGMARAPASNLFLYAADVDRYFDILERAAARVEGESDYARRIALIAEECQPMRDLFAFQEHEAKGRQAAEQGDGERAAEHYEKAFAAATDNRQRANTAFALGNAYRDLLGDDEKALDAYRRCMEIHIRGAGSAVRMHARMAAVGVLRRNERYDEAVALLDDFAGARRHDFWRVHALRARADIARDRGDLAAARAYLREALDVPGITEGVADAVRDTLDDLDE